MLFMISICCFIMAFRCSLPSLLPSLSTIIPLISMTMWFTHSLRNLSSFFSDSLPTSRLFPLLFLSLHILLPYHISVPNHRESVSLRQATNILSKDPCRSRLRPPRPLPSSICRTQNLLCYWSKRMRPSSKRCVCWWQCV